MPKIFRNWPVWIISLAVIILFARNYIPGTYLTGWDNLHPEFDLALNIKRSFFAVWQEYQGLGLLGGMGHASDLLRQLFLLILSFVFPDDLLRYIWVFVALLIGGLGAYSLSKFLLKKSGLGEDNSKPFALLSGLFYIFNLATIQTFYVPFEAFVGSFAFLPWLIHASISYFLGEGKRSLLFVSVILLLATPGAYIPTLFVVYLLSIVIVISFFLIQKFSKKSLKRAFALFLIIFAVNSFWLLPFLFFTATSSSVNLESKINQMATETIFLQNKEFGNISDVALLKGFWFKNVDPNFQGVFTYMMNPWRDHLAKPIISGIGYALFALVLLGLFNAIRLKKPILLAFSVLFIFAFTMLAVNTPPFSWIGQAFRIIPLFNQAFRFPFTKFSILAALTYSLFFAFGAYFIVDLVSKRLKRFNLLSLVFLIIATAGLIALAFPAFRLDLFYHKERLEIPKEYFDTFEYFKSQDPNTRIANFPQHTIWGWNFYRWGYGGSGFPWYGLKQPVIDRAFDVWSKNDENYYWEISEAIYSKDLKQLEDTLNKYQVTWLLLDKNVINPTSPKALFIPETEVLFSQIPTIKKEKQFGNIVIYKVDLKDKPNSFVFDASKLPRVNEYNFGNDDRAYASFGNYATDEKEFGYFYPFRSLFSGKGKNEKEFVAKEGRQTIEITRELPDFPSDADLLVPQVFEFEKTLPADIIVEKNSDGNLTLYAQIRIPEISIVRKSSGEEEILFEKSHKYFVSNISKDAVLPLNISVNGIANFELKTADRNKYLGSTFVVLDATNFITIKDQKSPPHTTDIDGKGIVSLFGTLSKAIKVKDIEKGDVLKITTAKINDNFLSYETWPGNAMKEQVGNCSNFRRGVVNTSLSDVNQYLEITSSDASACLVFYVPTLDHARSYAVFVQNENVKGKPLHFWMLNEDQKYAPIDTYVERNQSLSPSYFIVPPQEHFGTGYSIHLENISIGPDVTSNKLGKVGLFPIPYQFISSLAFETKGPVSKAENKSAVLDVDHPNESLYLVELDTSNLSDKTLVLSQGYDKGWKAYELKIARPASLGEAGENGEWTFGDWIKLSLPFVFGKNIGEHVKINNWENGWQFNQSSIVNRQSSIVLVYLPQYLGYLGFFILVITFIIVVIKSLRRSASDPEGMPRHLTENESSDRLSGYENSPQIWEKPASDDKVTAP